MPIVEFDSSYRTKRMLPAPEHSKGTKWVALALCVGWLLISGTNPALSGDTEASKTDQGQYKLFTPTGDIRRFVGETLHINISFLWFDNAATASVSFFEEGGKYYAILESETKGFVGFFTSYRKHRYKSTFDIIDNGRRLRTRKFEREVIIGDNVERTSHIFDYKVGIDRWFKYKNGKLTKEEQREIPEGIIFDDILAIFYNFRNSVYGKVERQANYLIHTIPDKDVDKIPIYINSEKEAEQYGEENGRKEGDVMLVKAVIPKVIFKTKSGELWFWISKHLVPVETTVKDYILLGDLHAVLVKREYVPPK